jgi:hypothetical protein
MKFYLPGRIVFLIITIESIARCMQVASFDYKPAFFFFVRK